MTSKIQVFKKFLEEEYHLIQKREYAKGDWAVMINLMLTFYCRPDAPLRINTKLRNVIADYDKDKHRKSICHDCIKNFRLTHK